MYKTKKTWEGIRSVINMYKTKKTREGIRSIISMYKTKLPHVSYINVKGKQIDNSKKVAESFNNFFVNVWPNTDKNIPSNPKIIAEKYLEI